MLYDVAEKKVPGRKSVKQIFIHHSFALSVRKMFLKPLTFRQDCANLVKMAKEEYKHARSWIRNSVYLGLSEGQTFKELIHTRRIEWQREKTIIYYYDYDFGRFKNKLKS